MPRVVRVAEVSWDGDIARGTGTITGTSSGALTGLPTTVASRFVSPEDGTSPEELLAAAHAACFTTSLALELTKAGTPPGRLDVQCSVTLDEVSGKRHQIVHSELEVRGAVPGCDAAAFAQAAEAADARCPFSALVRASATVSVSTQLL